MSQNAIQINVMLILNASHNLFSSSILLSSQLLLEITNYRLTLSSCKRSVLMKFILTKVSLFFFLHIADPVLARKQLQSSVIGL